MLYLMSRSENIKDTVNDLEQMKAIIVCANKVGAKTTERYGAIEVILTMTELINKGKI